MVKKFCFLISVSRNIGIRICSRVVEELEKVQALSSKTLQKTFGEGIKFTQAKYDAYTLDGTKADSEIN